MQGKANINKNPNYEVITTNMNRDNDELKMLEDDFVIWIFACARFSTAMLKQDRIIDQRSLLLFPDS